MDARAAPRYERGVPRWELRYAIACAGIIGWCLAYAFASWNRWTRLYYDPLERAWSWRTAAPSPVPIDYWGLVLWGVGGAVVAIGVTLVAAAAWRRPVPRAVRTLLGAWALTAFLYGGTYFTWTLWPF